jgi:hypothetical protein
VICSSDTFGVSIKFGLLCDLNKEWILGMVLINSLKHSKTYIRFYL